MQYLLIGGFLFIIILVSLTLLQTTHTNNHGPIDEHRRQKNRVYVRSDTSKYINSNGRIFVPSDTAMNGMTFAELEELDLGIRKPMKLSAQDTDILAKNWMEVIMFVRNLYPHKFVSR